MQAESSKNFNIPLKREVQYVYISCYRAEVHQDVQHLQSLGRNNLNIVMTQNILKRETCLKELGKGLIIIGSFHKIKLLHD